MNSRNQKAADEVIGRHSPRVTRMFNLYVRRMLGKKFNGFRILNQVPQTVPADRSVIYFSNHPGWYDPLVLILMAESFLPDHLAFGPMDADALKKYNFMKKIGIFGVEKDSARGAARFLQVSRGMLAMPGKVLLITPQGEFGDVRLRPIEFKPGLARLAADCGAIVQPLAMEFVFWDEPRPEILVNFGNQIDTSAETLEPAAWKTRLESELSTAQDDLARAVMARDPEPFVTYIDGKHGVNPVYDRWRYLKALLRGEKFSAAHTDTRKD
ncbi:MAG: lysophospholipid acyltransferase family protein [Anderseniella sp.]